MADIDIESPGSDSFALHGALSKAQYIFTPEQYGTVTADGSTDDSAAIQAAIDACDANRGGEVHFRAERYAIATGLTVNNQGTVLVGRGMPGAAGANGSSRIVVANGITGITFNSASSGGTHRTLGYGMRQLHVVAASGATTGSGIIVQNAENFICEDVQCSGFVGGVGLTIDGKAGNGQYAQLINYCAGDNLKSLHTKGTGVNGVRLFGGYMGGAGTTPRASSIGIHVETGDTLRLYGTVIQGYETGVYIESAAAGSELHGPRFEFCNICLRIGASANHVSLFGGSFTNSLLNNTGAGNKGIVVTSGATTIMLSPTTIAGTSTAIDDSGTGTIVLGQYAGSSAATSSSSVLNSDVTMTTNGTWYDGGSLTLAAGTWLILGQVQITAGSTAIRTLQARLHDGTNTLCVGVHVVTGTGTAGQVSIPVNYIATLAGSTTIKVQATSSVNSETLRGTSTTGTFIRAIQL